MVLLDHKSFSLNISSVGYTTHIPDQFPKSNILLSLITTAFPYPLLSLPFILILSINK